MGVATINGGEFKCKVLLAREVQIKELEKSVLTFGKGFYYVPNGPTEQIC